MRVFVTGASGWIGSAAVDELLAAGHEVTGLARSDASAAALAAKGVRVRRGDLDDLDSLPGRRRGRGRRPPSGQQARLREPGDLERGRARRRPDHRRHAGRQRAAVPAGVGVAGLSGGRPATEDDPSPFHGPDSPRGGAENLAFEFVDRGVHTVSLRFAPTVHGVGDHGFIAAIAGVARAQGVSGYPGDGTNRWAAVHRSDAARLVALGLAKAPAGSRLHAVAEDGIPSRRDRRGDRARPGLPGRPRSTRTTPGRTSAGSAGSSP